MDCAPGSWTTSGTPSRGGILKKRLQYYAHSKLLIIDDLGYLDIDEGGADLLFQLVSTRYEQRSTIITTNVGIGGGPRCSATRWPRAPSPTGCATTAT